MKVHLPSFCNPLPPSCNPLLLVIQVAMPSPSSCRILSPVIPFLLSFPYFFQTSSCHPLPPAFPFLLTSPSSNHHLSHNVPIFPPAISYISSSSSSCYSQCTAFSFLFPVFLLSFPSFCHPFPSAIIFLLLSQLFIPCTLFLILSSYCCYCHSPSLLQYTF